MTDRVDAGMKGGEPPAVQAPRDRAPAEAEVEQLRPGDDPVLVAGERGDRQLDLLSAT